VVVAAVEGFRESCGKCCCCCYEDSQAAAGALSSRQSGGSIHQPTAMGAADPEEVAMIFEYFGSRQGHPQCSPGFDAYFEWHYPLRQCHHLACSPHGRSERSAR
jgi:hypothetical protein